jgi:hypothetical protein
MTRKALGDAFCTRIIKSNQEGGGEEEGKGEDDANEELGKGV